MDEAVKLTRRGLLTSGAIGAASLASLGVPGVGEDSVSGVEPDRESANAPASVYPVAAPYSAWQRHVSGTAFPQGYYTWQLDRPKPALPSSYFWTWDHSCNWVLDDPGLQTTGCYNRYFKQPQTFVEDYRRLTDMAAGLGIKGIVIWGFLRDSHGGIEAAKQLASYAASRGVAIMPGVGTTWYGGVYYEGDHPASLTTFIKQHPDARMLDEKGEPRGYADEQGACAAHPAYQQWLRDAMAWLYREFDIGGVNLENGDFVVDHHPLMKELRKSWPADDPEPYFCQGASYRQALEAIGDRLPKTLGTYATYSGFNYGKEAKQNVTMGPTPPAMLKVLPPESICQWTLTGMLLKKPLPLAAYLDDGAPAAAFDNPNWPVDLKPTCRRSVGFVHQGSQWSGGSRYECVVSTIKEACLRAHRAGLEGVSIHGEVTSRHIPYALNYLAFSHFTHWPEDTLRDFGRKTLGPVLGGEQHGEDFAVILAHWDAGTITDDLRKLAAPEQHGFPGRGAASRSKSADDYQPFQFWDWLSHMVKDEPTRRRTGMLPV